MTDWMTLDKMNREDGTLSRNSARNRKQLIARYIFILVDDLGEHFNWQLPRDAMVVMAELFRASASWERGDVQGTNAGLEGAALVSVNQATGAKTSQVAELALWLADEVLELHTVNDCTCYSLPDGREHTCHYCASRAWFDQRYRERYNND